MSMDTVFDSKKNKFEAHGVINRMNNTMSIKDVRSLFFDAQIDLKRIVQTYHKFLMNDGKILGIEKTMLIKEIDKLFNLLILFYLFLGEDGNKENEGDILIERKRHSLGLYINIRLRGNTWSGFGSFEDNFYDKVNNFNDFYFKILAKEFAEFVRAFNEYSVDEITNNDEAVGRLKDEILDIWFNILRVIYMIEKCIIND